MKTIYTFLVFCVIICVSAEAENETKIPDQTDTEKPQKLNIKYYYETHCPYCREFETEHFGEIIQKLHAYLDIQTYPYGNVLVSKLPDNSTEYECQHGIRECYGNKLHGCALDIIKNQTAALLFNNCMMDNSRDYSGSDDTAADACASNMGLDSTAIKECAKGDRGNELFKQYGEDTRKAHIRGVPSIWINGTKYDRSDDVLEDICFYFNKPIPPCENKYIIN